MEGGEVLMGKGNSADDCKELTVGFTASASTEAMHCFYDDETVLQHYKNNLLTEDETSQEFKLKIVKSVHLRTSGY